MNLTDLTFKNLQDRCLDYGYGEVDRNRFKTWLNEAQMDIMTRRRWSWAGATQTITTSANTQNYTTLTDTAVIYWGRLKPTVSSIPEPRYIDNMTLADDWTRHAQDATDTGMPQAYTIWGSPTTTWTLTFFPIPDNVYTYTLYYYRGIVDLSGDSDISIIPSQWRMVLVKGALVAAAERDRDQQAIARRTADYENMIRRMEGADPLTDRESERKARMPRHYHNMYDGASGGFWRP